MNRSHPHNSIVGLVSLADAEDQEIITALDRMLGGRATPMRRAPHLSSAPESIEVLPADLVQLQQELRQAADMASRHVESAHGNS